MVQIERIDGWDHKIIVMDPELLGDHFLEITFTVEGMIVDRYDSEGSEVIESRWELWGDVLDSLQ